MISKEMAQALNDQINEEMFSFYLYLSMSAWFETQQLPGMAGWMRKQAEEEMSHAMKFFKFLNERGGAVTLQAIAKPKASWKSAAAAFGEAFNHERHITGCINALADKAIAAKDHATLEFLQWFIKEQVEEEATVEPIVYKLKATEGHMGTLFHLDHQLGKRAG
ncbi:MAG: ferritin [Acidobacteriota bacterium]